jgi:hypothetical protein
VSWNQERTITAIVDMDMGRMLMEISRVRTQIDELMKNLAMLNPRGCLGGCLVDD